MSIICTHYIYIKKKKSNQLGFPGGTVVKSPPANAGDTVVREDPTCRGAMKPVHHNY